MALPKQLSNRQIFALAGVVFSGCLFVSTFTEVKRDKVSTEFGTKDAFAATLTLPQDNDVFVGRAYNWDNESGTRTLIVNLSDKQQGVAATLLMSTVEGENNICAMDYTNFTGERKTNSGYVICNQTFGGTVVKSLETSEVMFEISYDRSTSEEEKQIGSIAGGLDRLLD